MSKLLAQATDARWSAPQQDILLLEVAGHSVALLAGDGIWAVEVNPRRVDGTLGGAKLYSPVGEFDSAFAAATRIIGSLEAGITDAEGLRKAKSQGRGT